MWKRGGCCHDLTMLSAAMLGTTMLMMVMMLCAGTSRAQIDWAEDDDDPGELVPKIHALQMQCIWLKSSPFASDFFLEFQVRNLKWLDKRFRFITACVLYI